MFGSVILNLWCVCVRYGRQVAVPYTHTHTHTHHRFKRSSKKFLGGKRFDDDDDDLKDAVQKWLTSQAAAFYEEGIQKLVPH